MNMPKREMTLAATLVAICVAGAVQAANPIAYPAKGQSDQQQQKDSDSCHTWAKNKTGVDPAAVPPPSSGPAVGGGERVRGAVGGAVVGGIVGDDDGARTGAAVGTVAGGVRARQNKRAQAAAQQGTIDTFNRAYATCMEGRGYTVK